MCAYYIFVNNASWNNEPYTSHSLHFEIFNREHRRIMSYDNYYLCSVG